LTDFPDKHTINILLLQEVKTEDVHNIFGYTAHLKIRDTGRGTAISAKEGIDLTRVTRLPSEGRIAAVYATVDTGNLHGSLPPDLIVRISLVFCPGRIAWGSEF
jgi:hypothetical protein